jgi:hypothetical protein
LSAAPPMNLREWNCMPGYVALRRIETEGLYEVRLAGSGVKLAITTHIGDRRDHLPALGELLLAGPNPPSTLAPGQAENARAERHPGLRWPAFSDGLPAHARRDWQGWRVLFNPYLLTEDAQLDPLGDQRLYAIWHGGVYALVSPEGVLHALHPKSILCRAVPDPRFGVERRLGDLWLPAGSTPYHALEKHHPGVGEVIASPIPDVVPGELLVFPRSGVAFNFRIGETLVDGEVPRVLVVPWENTLGKTTDATKFHLPEPDWQPRT